MCLASDGRLFLAVDVSGADPYIDLLRLRAPMAKLQSFFDLPFKRFEDVTTKGLLVRPVREENVKLVLAWELLARKMVYPLCQGNPGEEKGHSNHRNAGKTKAVIIPL